MTQLVYLESNKIDSVPFTTSDVIAEYAEVSYRSVQRIIDRHESDLQEFGRVRFQITPFETKGGIQNKKIYHLNELQSTLLITYLKNTKPVRKFKKALVKEFYAMRTELMKRQTAKLDRKPIRRELTEVIREDPDHSKWDYKLYTDLAYKAVLGKNAAQIRKDRGAPKKSVASDYMTSDELKAIARVENQIAVLKEMGLPYEQIKLMILNRQMIGNLVA